MTELYEIDSQWDFNSARVVSLLQPDMLHWHVPQQPNQSDLWTDAASFWSYYVAPCLSTKHPIDVKLSIIITVII